MEISPDDVKSALRVTAAVSEAIREAARSREGWLYAILLDRMDLNTRAHDHSPHADETRRAGASHATLDWAS
jgi:hypothetical protein